MPHMLVTLNFPSEPVRTDASSMTKRQRGIMRNRIHTAMESGVYYLLDTDATVNGEKGRVFIPSTMIAMIAFVDWNEVPPSSQPSTGEVM